MCLLPCLECPCISKHLFVSCTICYEPIYIFYEVLSSYIFYHVKWPCHFCGMTLVCTSGVVSSPSILDYWGQWDDVSFLLVFKVRAGSVLHPIIRVSAVSASNLKTQNTSPSKTKQNKALDFDGRTGYRSFFFSSLGRYKTNWDPLVDIKQIEISMLYFLGMILKFVIFIHYYNRLLYRTICKVYKWNL